MGTLTMYRPAQNYENDLLIPEKFEIWVEIEMIQHQTLLGTFINLLLMVAPWLHKDKKLVTLKISTDPSYIWSTDSKTVLR